MSPLLGGATVCTGIGSDGGKQGCATGAAHAAAFDAGSVATASCVGLLAFSRVVVAAGEALARLASWGPLASRGMELDGVSGVEERADFANPHTSL